MNPSKSIQRNKVIWLGESPSEETISEFEQRWLILHSTSVYETSDTFNLSRAIVIPFKDSISTPRIVRRIISEGDAYNFGLIIVVVIPESEYDKEYSYFSSMVD